MRVLITARIPETVVDSIRREHEVEVYNYDTPMDRDNLLKRVYGKQGLICTIKDKIDSELLQQADKLQMIANYGVGFDHIDLAAATAKGVRVSNTPGVLTEATAELTFALILAVARRVVEGHNLVKSKDFPLWSPMVFLGTQVTGKVLGILGLGDIGKAVTRMAKAFHMNVLYHNRKKLDKVTESKLGVEYREFNSLLSESDFVSLHVPLTPETRRLLSKDQFRIMKKTAFVINASRGPVIDEQALVEALKSREIAGAGLDVYENEPEVNGGLLDLPNVVLLPHVGSATTETRTAMAELAAKNLLEGLSGRRPPNCLNCERL